MVMMMMMMTNSADTDHWPMQIRLGLTRGYVSRTAYRNAYTHYTESWKSYLPSRRRVPVVWKAVTDPLINVTESHFPGGGAGNCRRDEVRVAERWLGVDAWHSGHHRLVTVVDRFPGRRRAAAGDETAQPTSLDVEPAKPVHLGQTALERVHGTVGVVRHVESNVAQRHAGLPYRPVSAIVQQQ